MRLHVLALAALTLLMAGPLLAQEPLREQLDIVYRAGGDERDEDVKLDLFAPAGEPAQSRPAVVFIHGGGWREGSKKDFRDAAKVMAKAGHVGVSIDYRLAPKHKFPAQIEDVKSALRWLRANAEKWRIDDDRIALVGASAGGHLALLAGFTLPKDNLEGPGAADGSAGKVCAVVNIFGPTDFTRRDWPDPIEKLLEDFLGGSRQAIPQTFVVASPVTYIHQGGPPVLTFHGTKDPIVPYSQATLLNEALLKAGESSRLETIEGKGHGDWSGEEWMQVMLKTAAFLGNAFAKK